MSTTVLMLTILVVNVNSYSISSPMSNTSETSTTSQPPSDMTLMTLLIRNTSTQVSVPPFGTRTPPTKEASSEANNGHQLGGHVRHEHENEHDDFGHDDQGHHDNDQEDEDMEQLRQLKERHESRLSQQKIAHHDGYVGDNPPRHNHHHHARPYHPPRHYHYAHYPHYYRPRRRWGGGRYSGTGITELLIVLAPMAAIPLIGSAALTTFTTMFATSAMASGGKRRKREVVARELLEVSTKVDGKRPAGGNKRGRGKSGHGEGLERFWSSLDFNSSTLNGSKEAISGHQEQTVGALIQVEEVSSTLATATSFFENNLTSSSNFEKVSDETVPKIPTKLPTPNYLEVKDTGKVESSKELSELDTIQRYLSEMRPSGNYHDEIIATYLTCNGMLATSNHCLERLTCHFADDASSMKELEKDVSSLIIYAILKNAFVDEQFKGRLRKSADFGRKRPGRCNAFSCDPSSMSNVRRSAR